MVEALSPEHVDAAATTSYAFWVHQKDNPAASDGDEKENDLRIKSAMKEARRHYIGEKKDFDKAKKAIEEAMNFRIEKHIDLLRQIGDSSSFDEVKDEKEREILEHYRSLVEEELTKQLNVIGGFDREGRCVTIRWHRNDPTYDEEGYFLGMIYVVERSIAATEIHSRGKQEKLTGLLDMGVYDSKNSIPASLYRANGRRLQRFYPERLSMFFMFDPPMWLRVLYGLIAPFVDPVTRKKIVLISGSAKRVTLDKMVDTENSFPALKEDGKIRSDVTPLEFITEVPFHGVHGLTD